MFKVANADIIFKVI